MSSLINDPFANELKRLFRFNDGNRTMAATIEREREKEYNNIRNLDYVG